MQIRQAYRDEAAEIAPLVQAAVGDIAAELANSPPHNDAVQDLLVQLIECEGTRIGYSFIDVVELDGGAVGGMAVSYSGRILEAANKPTFRFFCAGTYEGLPKLIQQNVLPLLQAKEAEADEYYLDALAVNPRFRGGQGLGTALLKHVHRKAKRTVLRRHRCW